MTKGPIRLDVAVSYALPRAGLPSAVSFRKGVAAALNGRIREADGDVEALRAAGHGLSPMLSRRS